nr:hypothetical protein [Escherichia coli]
MALWHEGPHWCRCQEWPDPLNRLIRCVCGKKIGPDPRNFNQRVSLGRNDLLIRTFLRNRLLNTFQLFFIDG